MLSHADVVSCVHPVTVLNAAFCMTCSFLMLVEDARGDHMEESYSRAPPSLRCCCRPTPPACRCGGSDNPVSLEKPCQASLPPDQQGRHSLGRQPEVQYVA